MGLRGGFAGVVAPLARAYVRHVPGHVGKTALARGLLEPALRRRPRTFVTTTRPGFRMAGTTQDMIQRYVYVFGVWEPDLTGWFRRRPLSGRTVVDVGANVGYFSLLASGLVGTTGRVVAVEALPSTFALLEANLARNDTGNVRALNLAASTEHGVLELFGGEVHNSGTTTTVPTAGLASLGTVTAAPLADVLTDEEIATARVVKIDVEGAERHVVDGLLGALGRMPEDVELVVELTPDDGGGASHVVASLRDLGFHAYLLPSDYRLARYAAGSPAQSAVRLRAPIDRRCDVVFSRCDADALP